MLAQNLAVTCRQRVVVEVGELGIVERGVWKRDVIRYVDIRKLCIGELRRDGCPGWAKWGQVDLRVLRQQKAEIPQVRTANVERRGGVERDRVATDVVLQVGAYRVAGIRTDGIVYEQCGLLVTVQSRVTREDPLPRRQVVIQPAGVLIGTRCGPTVRLVVDRGTNSAGDVGCGKVMQGLGQV